MSETSRCVDHYNGLPSQKERRSRNRHWQCVLPRCQVAFALLASESGLWAGTEAACIARGVPAA